MIIKQEVIEYFNSKNIQIKNNPYNINEYKNKVWKELYQSFYNYHKDAHLGFDENMQSIHPTHEQLDKDAIDYANKNLSRKLNNWYDSKLLFIEYKNNDNVRLIYKKIPIKSKEITIDFIEKLIIKNEKLYSLSKYSNFSDLMNNLLKKYNYNSYIYPTTYGIGVWIFFNYNADKIILEIKNILNQNKIEYKTEVSDAEYVYRFRISKKFANLQLIESI